MGGVFNVTGNHNKRRSRYWQDNIAKELAKRLSYQHIDLDNYYYRWDTEIPFTESLPREEVIERVMNDTSKHPFVMSGSIGSILWDSVNPLFDLAVLLFVPVAIRLERVRAREFAQFGERTLVGGDMYEQFNRFYAEVEEYETGKHPSTSVTLERHERWAAELLCPVLRVDGTISISENAAWLAEQYLLIQSSK